MIETISYDTVLKTIREWPLDRRFNLVQDVLATLAPTFRVPRPRRKTLDKALGLLATGQPAPSDAEIQQWLDEHSMGKQG